MAAAKEVSSNRLECPICFRLLESPKLLFCNHTFCEQCLIKLHLLALGSESPSDQLKCPICCHETPLWGNGLEVLATNQEIRDMVVKFKAAVPEMSRICSICKSTEQPTSEANDPEGGEYICPACLMTSCSAATGHEAERNTRTAGAQTSRSRWECQKCTAQCSVDKLFVCLDCRAYICQKCRDLFHKLHQFIDAEEEAKHNYTMKQLQRSAKERMDRCSQRIDNIKHRKRILEYTTEIQISKINLARDEIVQMADKSRDELVRYCKTFVEGIMSELDELEKDDSLQVSRLAIAAELAGSNSAVTGKASFQVKQNLGMYLQNALEYPERDHDEPKKIAIKAKGIQFQRCAERSSAKLGNIEIGNEWAVKNIVNLPSKYCMSGATLATGGRIMIALKSGGVVSIQGCDSEKRVIKHVNVIDIACLSDGRLVLRDNKNEISIYTRDYMMMGQHFKSHGRGAGIRGGLDVDQRDKIYIGYERLATIQIFKPEGGQPIRDICCIDVIAPEQIFATAQDGKVLVKSCYSVKVVDIASASAGINSCVTREDVHPYPTVCRDGSILIAWVKQEEELFKVERYSQDLSPMNTLTENQRFQVSKKGHWYYVIELSPRVVAFCTPDKVIVIEEQPGWVIEGT